MMRDKQVRQMAIKRLITTIPIPNQDQLQHYLQKEGIIATQATISRDLRELKIVKTHSPSGYKYTIPSVTVSDAITQDEKTQTASGVISIEFSTSLAVIKTKPGYAAMIASMIDIAIGNTIMGSIAGDDTIIIALRDGTQRKHIIKDLSAIVPGLEDKLI